MFSANWPSMVLALYIPIPHFISIIAKHFGLECFCSGRCDIRWISKAVFNNPSDITGGATWSWVQPRTWQPHYGVYVFMFSKYLPQIKARVPNNLWHCHMFHIKFKANVVTIWSTAGALRQSQFGTAWCSRSPASNVQILQVCLNLDTDHHPSTIYHPSPIIFHHISWYFPR